MAATKGTSTVTTKKLPSSTPSIKGAAPRKTPAIADHIMSARMDDGGDYKAHSDHRTLMEAEHIKADPAKMHKVRQVAGRKMAAASAINSIADIKAAAKQLRAGKLPGKASEASSEAKHYPGGELDEEGLSHHRTLEEAEHIKSSPSRMAGVRKIAGSKYAAAHAIHKMFGESEE